MSVTKRWLCTLVCVMCASAGIARSAAVTYSRVELTGDAAPGTSPGTVFQAVQAVGPAVNGQGNLFFQVSLTGGDVVAGTNDQALYAGGSGGLQLVARTGNQAAQFPAGVNYATLGTAPVAGDNGQLAFSAGLTGTGITTSNDGTIYEGLAGSLQLAFREGDQAPGEPAGATYSPSNLRLGGNGRVYFFATSTNGAGIWGGSPGAIQLFAHSGDAAPGTPAGVTFTTNFTNLPVMNDAGQAAFRVSLAGTGVTASNDQGIWAGTPGAIQYVARNGDVAPGTGAGVVFAWNPSVTRPVINNAGQVSFAASVAGTGVTTSNDTGLWTGVPGALQLVAREGDQAPDVPAGALFAGFGPSVIDGVGRAAFRAGLTGTGVTTANNAGVFFGSAGNLHLIARKGDAAPGTDPGVTFGDVDSSSMELNNRGDILFRGTLTGTGVTTDNDTGWWLADPIDGVTKIIREGDLFDVDPGPGQDLRTIFNMGILSNSGPEDGQPISLNENGQIGIKLLFTDGTSGIFIASVPEPTTALLLAAPAAAYVLGRSRSPRRQRLS